MKPLGVAVVGCGLMGRRRAETAVNHPATRLVATVDTNADAAAALARSHEAEALTDWRDALARQDVDIVVVATPNGHLTEIGCAALEAGRHVLLEKPMGRSLAEAEQLARAARNAAGVFKIGFNHRYHPATRRAHDLVAGDVIGRVVTLRARYGHGSRPGCETEWRAAPGLAGGGELLDQGVHVMDLFHWFAGPPAAAIGLVQTAVWPVAPLEDNGYGLFRFANGAVGQLHVSMTQWKNLFSLEVAGTCGAVAVEGLAGSYGPQRLTVYRRNPAGGAPAVEEERFDDADPSWTLEWADFVASIEGGVVSSAGAGDGLVAMRMVDALYASARTGSAVHLS